MHSETESGESFHVGPELAQIIYSFRIFHMIIDFYFKNVPILHVSVQQQQYVSSSHILSK